MPHNACYLPLIRPLACLTEQLTSGKATKSGWQCYGYASGLRFLLNPDSNPEPVFFIGIVMIKNWQKLKVKNSGVWI
jgi:hypothetical protein